MFTPRLNTIAKALLVAALAGGHLAHAAGTFAGQEIDPLFRAKVMKEKAKQDQLKADPYNFMAGGNGASAQCGSQSIGNVDTGGKIGAAPREVFVFAPNAINLVSSQGCK
ncbi:MAG: hypothetical protein ABI702_14735 [Burkholderiales bacterium]